MKELVHLSKAKSSLRWKSLTPHPSRLFSVIQLRSSPLIEHIFEYQHYFENLVYAVLGRGEENLDLPTQLLNIYMKRFFWFSRSEHFIDWGSLKMDATAARRNVKGRSIPDRFQVFENLLVTLQPIKIQCQTSFLKSSKHRNAIAKYRVTWK